MTAAEGEVQEKGYVASFPSLINAAGKATYIMVLKDNGGLVKLYALVNVENHSIVATGATQQEAKQAYVELLGEYGLIDSDKYDDPDNSFEKKTITVTVGDIRIVTINGNSVVYMNADDGKIYKMSISEDETLMLIKTGDKLFFTYRDTENESIKQIVSWKYSD